MQGTKNQGRETAVKTLKTASTEILLSSEQKPESLHPEKTLLKRYACAKLVDLGKRDHLKQFRHATYLANRLMKEHFRARLRKSIQRLVTLRDPDNFQSLARTAKGVKFNDEYVDGSTPWLKPPQNMTQPIVSKE